MTRAGAPCGATSDAGRSASQVVTESRRKRQARPAGPPGAGQCSPELVVVVVIFGIGTLLHVLMLSLLRHRREFGVLRSIGFLRRQIAATVAWQAITVVAVGIVVGVPIGLALGRLVWNLAASEFGVVAVVSTPNIRIALIAAGSLVASCFVVATPAAVAATSPAAPLLRSE